MGGDINLDVHLRISRRLLAFSAAAALLCAGGYALSESLTMTTYYPAPSGVYRRLVSTAQTILARDGGNVGVGTTNPQARLDVNGNSTLRGAVNTGGSIELNSTNAGNRFAYVDLHSDDTYADYALRLIRWNGGPNSDSGVFHRGTGRLRLSAQDAGSLTLETNGAARLAVEPGGGVGIGTISPRARQGTRAVLLEVSANAVAQDVYLSAPVFGSPRWASKGLDASRFYTKTGPTVGDRGGGTSVYCNAGDVMVGGGCSSVDTCRSNDSSGFKSYPDGNGWFCAQNGAPCTNQSTAYVRCYTP
jgi:hypothetical protein